MNFKSKSDESTRMFESNLLEGLSKVHWSVPLIVFLPVIGFFSWYAIARLELSTLNFAAYFMGGLAFWTVTEYVLHRFIFHWVPSSDWGKRLHFIFHGVHHDYPNDAKRLVMPPSASIPLSMLFLGLFYAALPAYVVPPFFAAFMTGYLFYDMTHYAIHHGNFKSGFWKQMKHHHMTHHYVDPNKGYGVSSKLWDKIFQSDFIKKS